MINRYCIFVDIIILKSYNKVNLLYKNKEEFILHLTIREQEKLMIVKEHLIKKQLEAHSLKPD